MRASLVKELGGGFAVADIELAEPIGREVVVDIRASGLCHTDLTYASFDMGMSLPAVFGHEAAGVVAAVGPDVGDVSVGDRVVGCLVQYCGRCGPCQAGRPTLCQHPEATLRAAGLPPRLSLGGTPVTQGFGLGGFAERALVHESQLVVVPDSMPFAQAALLACGGVTGAGAVLNTADVQPGQSVVVVGAGGVGLNSVNGAVVAGATTIVAVDVAAPKLELARSFGATHVIDSAAADAADEVKRITGGGADVVLDYVGTAQTTVRSLEMTAPGGALYLIGIVDPAAVLPVSVLGLIGSQKRVQGIVMGSSVPRRDIRRYADLYLQGRFQLDGLVSQEIALDEIDDGYAALHDPAVARVVVTKF
jgi:S-(hydroxymethyl)glutathione dehydrogenase/alcohol dehydrogenase